MKTIDISYNFKFKDNTKETFRLKLDRESLEPIIEKKEQYPDWTKLDFNQCPNCPLNVDKTTRCPLTLNLVNIVKRFEKVLSHDQLEMEVITEERTILQKTTAQRGLCSLMGLLIATSGCPHTIFFKPMARFHLPLANEEETIYRAASMYLLAQYFCQEIGKGPDLSLEGLREIYNNIEIVDTSIANRLRTASKEDASVNAIILLNIYAKNMPYVIEDSIDEIKYLFKPYLK